MYNSREYRVKIGKPKIRRRMVALALAASLGVGGIALIKSNNAKKVKEERIEIPQEVLVGNYADNKEILVDPQYIVQEVSTYIEPEVLEINEEVEQEEVVLPTYTGINKGDSVISTTTVNMRLNTSADSKKLGELPQGSVVDRILSIGNWDLIRYNNELAYVCGDYTNTNDVDYNNEYYYVEEDNDIVRTTTRLHLRLGPSTNETDLGLLDKDEELIVIGKTRAYLDSNDVWYIVRARGQIGFVKAEYTRSLKDVLKSHDSSITNIEVKKVGYLKDNTAVRYNPNGDVSSYADKYQLVQVLQENGNWCLVNIDGTVGYVEKNSIKNIKGTFLVVDISSQRVYEYCDTDIAFASRCTTGKNSSPTELGVYTPYGKSSSHNFHDNLSSRFLWMPFNGGQGFHDAPWEKNSDFGNPEYTKKHGSAGCVRLPDDAADYIFNNISKNTTVLIKK